MEIYDFLKSWKRLCNAMTQMDGCEDCPIVRNTHGARCGDMPCEMQDVESIAREVEKWAADHPEPEYPTWWKWLESMGIVSKMKSEYSEIFDTICAGPRMFKPIPADIAQKLGIEPK